MPGSVHVRPDPAGWTSCRQTACESDVSRMRRFIVHGWPRQNTTAADLPAPAASGYGSMHTRDFGAWWHRAPRSSGPRHPANAAATTIRTPPAGKSGTGQSKAAGGHRRVRPPGNGSRIADRASVAVVPPAHRRDLLPRIRYTEKDSPYHRAASSGPACRTACHAGARADRLHVSHITSSRPTEAHDEPRRLCA